MKQWKREYGGFDINTSHAVHTAPKLMGGRARVSEFFAGKRRLSITQIQRLKEKLGIPADLLIG